MILVLNRKPRRSILVLGILFVMQLSACNGSHEAAGEARKILGQDEVSGIPKSIPPQSKRPEAGTQLPAESNAEKNRAFLGKSCHSDDPDWICLALKYVVYQDSDGEAVVSKDLAVQNLAEINQIWSQCRIAFEIDEYKAVDPRTVGLDFNTSYISEIEDIRSTFEDSTKLVVVTTGSWSGSLSSEGANAWTAMPGNSLYGVVLESSVGDYSNIIAHELGHYLNLDHSSWDSNVMSAIIYSDSSDLSNSQCEEARSTAAYYWKAMYR